MKLLVTGKGGRSGSWAMRGVQLGNALGATVKPLATTQDTRQADLTIVVKRTPDSVLSALREAKARWVYDVVDAYPQPQSSAWSRGEAIEWVRARIEALKPDAVLWPTQRMREDCDTGLPGFVLPHHARSGIAVNPIRQEIRNIGYEGRAIYLNGWEGELRRQCHMRGWSFVINPAELAEVDVVVAFRGGEWAGYVPRHYKSNVKLANAHASGTPFIGNAESGYMEMATGCEYWADDFDNLRIALNWLESQSAREQISDRFRQAAYTVEHAAADLRGFLETL
jgi:hypothetical protein